MRTKGTRAVGASLLALMICDLAAGRALAETDKGQVEELVVTARKREERLRDVPTAATALSADDIRQLGGLPTTQDLLANVPGANFADTSNPVTSEISIRGSGTGRATSAEAGVGLYRDGVYIGGGAIGGRTFTKADLFDPGRIEVLRGVQGALNGRNAVGGAVTVNSARPTQQAGGYAVGEVANNDRTEAQLVVNQPLTEHLALRLGADVMRQEKGFYYNPERHEYFDAQRTDIVRGQLGYANGPFTANLLAEHGRDRLPGLMYQLVIAPSAAFPKGLSQDRFDMLWNSPSSAKQQVNYLEFTTGYDMGVATLSTTTGYRERRSQNAYDRDAASITFYRNAVAAGLVAPAAVNTVLAGDYALGGDSLDFTRIFYQDVHLAGAERERLTWLIGAEYFDLRDESQNILTRTPTRAIASPGTDDVGVQDFTSWAAYSSLGYDLTTRLNLTGELRYTSDDNRLVSNRLDLASGLPTGVGFGVDDKTRSDNLSYTATLSYKLMGWLLYGKVGSAYRAGGFNTALGDPRQPTPIPASYDNEIATAYEVGAKGDVTGFLYATLAAYQTDYRNLVAQGDNGCFVGNPVCPVQATPFAFNAGKAKLWGFEVALTAHAEVLGGEARLQLGGSRQGGHIESGVYAGKREPQQPDWTATFNLGYRRPLANGLIGFVNLNGSGRWGGVQEIDQTPELHDYVVYNGRIGVERGPWQLAVWSRNLGDESYLVFENPGARRWNIPRTYGAELRYQW